MCGQWTTSVIVYNQLKGARRQVHLDARQTEQGLACCELVTMSMPEVGTEITFLVRVYSGKWPRENSSGVVPFPSIRPGGVQQHSGTGRLFFE